MGLAGPVNTNEQAVLCTTINEVVVAIEDEATLAAEVVAHKGKGNTSRGALFSVSTF
jgi:hypothetical protein